MVQSIPELIRAAVAEHADRPCLLTRTKTGIETSPYRAFGEQMEAAAAGLYAAGIEPGERVVLVSENRPEWVTADLGILCNGAVTVPLYPSLPSAQVEPLVQRVRARVAIVEDAAQLAKFDEVRERLPQLERIYVFDSDKVPTDHPLARPWSELMSEGVARRAELADALAGRAAALGPDDLATIIFTSGTTGVPKGAMLTHGNLVSNVFAAQERIDLQAGETMVTFLPLSHVFQRLVTYLGLHIGGAALYNRNLRSLLPDILAVRPSLMIVVPRFLEMVRDRVTDGIRAKRGVAGLIARWAMDVAKQWARCYAEDRTPSAWLRWQYRWADQRVFSAIREQIGLDRLRYAVSGGAALSPAVGAWYYGIGLTVLQGYGLTETSPVVAVNDPHGRFRFDTIGPPIADVEVRIADDGELLVRGPNVMRGYFEMPAETAEAIDPDGWFHTGDIGEYTPEGHLRITDRKKNIMVLANGKKVAPVPYEAMLQESPLIDRVMLIGDHQSVVTALIVPAFENLRQALLAAGESVPEGDDHSWVASPTAAKLVQAEIERLSSGLASFERVRKFRLLERDFTLEQGELTPSLKIRREVIREHFADHIREMAGEGE